MRFYCKHCHNFWAMKITRERSSPVQLQTVVSKFLWLLRVMFFFSGSILDLKFSLTQTAALRCRSLRWKDITRRITPILTRRTSSVQARTHYWQSRSPDYRYDRDWRDWNRSRSLSSERAGVSWFTDRLTCYYTGCRRGECKTTKMCGVSHFPRHCRTF